MAGQPAYRFLPWVRRGLASAVTQPDAASSHARAVVTAGITVSGAGDSGVQLQLYGPGDVAGLDPRVIVRVEPRPNATDVEPNYVPAIEFDPPDFPWLFTPTIASSQERLRPWCILIVVDTSVVMPPHLERGAPLPMIEVPAASVLGELPDLDESWAWAHAQVLSADGTVATLRSELSSAPDRQLSRILCPRRLEPNKRYCACLVPAFAVGVVRGLGGVPNADATLAPAWSVAGTEDVRLPVYYHWEFATGPQGDFESLARALEPYKCDAAEVGVEKMFIGAAGPGLPSMLEDDPAGILEQDGALRAPLASSGSLADVPAIITDGLRNVLNAASATIAGDAAAANTGALGPPLYGEWPIDRHALGDDDPDWFHSLNLDPRARVAAGLGAEVVRENQEAFMEVCWDQVGRVLDANEALSRARLALEAARRVHERHFKPLPSDVLAQIASPWHERVLHGAVTVRKAIAATSMPDATTDVAMRRLTSGQRPVLKKAARAHRSTRPASQSARPTLARTLAAGRPDVDPARFIPGGLVQLDLLSKVSAPSSGNVDLAAVGVPMQLSSDQFGQLSSHFADLQAQPVRTTPPIKVRSNLPATGLVTRTQLAEVDAVSAPTNVTIVDRRALIGDVLVASEQKPAAVSFLITVGNRSAQSRVDALDVDTGGRVVVRPTTGTTATTVGSVSPTVARTSSARISSAITSLPPNSLDRRGRTAPDLVASTTVDDPTLRSTSGTLSLGSRTANTVAPPTRDPVVIQRFQTAFQTAATTLELGKAEPTPALVVLDLAAVRGTILQKTDPLVTVPLRTAARIRVAGVRIDQLTSSSVSVTAALDRIMAAPSIVTPLYELLARHDRGRLLPGVDQIPDNSITLLETNARFVTSFLGGANHEMNRELLWRRYPTDQRGTVLRRFWDWLDDGDDIPAMHTWNAAGPLGSHARGGDGGQLVLLVRGKLLRRYPNSVIYAWRAVGTKLKDPPADSDLRPPVFSGHFPPDITFVGFDLTFDEITQGDGWFFVIQEQPTEPRFGFDEVASEAPTIPPSWSDATWAEVGVAPGGQLRLAANPLAGTTRNGATFGRDAAHLAVVLLQKPMRVALHGSQLAHVR